MLALPSSVSRLPARALALLPLLPWYGWAAAAAALGAIVFGASTAGAASGDEGGGEPPTRPDGAPPLLKAGSSGPWVAFLQGKLGIPSSGTFDAATGEAVRAFQASKGLTADEIVGPATWGALGVEGASSPAPQPGGGSPAPKPQPGPVVPAPSGPPTTEDPFGLGPTIDGREGVILSWASQGAYQHEWWPLTYKTKDGHTVKVWISRRAFALSNGPSTKLIVNASMRTAQKIADILGGSIPTTRILDEAYKQASKVVMNSVGVPPSQKWQGTGGDDTGSKTGRMYDQSAYLEKLVAGAQGLVVNEGKDWVQTRHYWNPPEGLGPTSSTGTIHNHANFGWYYPPSKSHSPGGVPVIQSVGGTHAPGFTDYSQLLRFVRNDIEIDGTPWTWAAALADPSVSSYIQDEGGTLPGARHPDL
jgi:peptidoglycan hydrolase-like protein with peptidoglycan-binding domain